MIGEHALYTFGGKIGLQKRIAGWRWSHFEIYSGQPKLLKSILQFG
jgi:hypothetical protein